MFIVPQNAGFGKKMPLPADRPEGAVLSLDLLFRFGHFHGHGDVGLAFNITGRHAKSFQ